MKEDFPLISVLIGTRNRPILLENCLQSIYSQNYNNFEIIILDDNSDIPLTKNNYLFLQNEKNIIINSRNHLGVAGSRNLLLKQAKGEIFIFLDDDAIIKNEDVLIKIIEYFKEEKKLGIIAFNIINFKFGNNYSYIVPFSKYKILKNKAILKNSSLVSYYCGGGHAIHKKVIDKCGLYDENIFYGEEELDLSYKALNNNFFIKYYPDIIIHHFPQPPVLKQKKPKFYFHIQNRFLIAKKYIPYRYILAYLFIWLSFYFFKAVKSKEMIMYFQACLKGFSLFFSTSRVGLNSNALKYLKKHHGRLWR